MGCGQKADGASPSSKSVAQRRGDAEESRERRSLKFGLSAGLSVCSALMFCLHTCVPFVPFVPFVPSLEKAKD
jgi:ABC-type nickel/cobalt efflux system permease component RcnA